ncbi:hypothetical protein O181_030878 [Austropuccinia psidii MF-1]|uniref:Uncharacterized protein n=1 Tax=Austropuccinia psidii MF-1 TaxID=1389203 RepID=A0A9Q3CWC7_9BASI|nr:hypothetical protein [Austropuccinia psidii MF-1]
MLPHPCSLPSLRSHSALLKCLRRCLPSLHSQSALLTCLQLCLPFLCSRSALSTCLQCRPHTGLMLMLLQRPQDETTMLPPSLPSPLLTLLNPLLIFSTAYNSYAPAAPSRYASNAVLNPPYA